MLTNVPLLIVPFIVYNIQVFSKGADVWQGVVMTWNLPSEAVWSMTLGDVMLLSALALLFIEILKATRIGASSIIDHLLSTFVFIAFLVEFLLVKEAATRVFVLLMAIALIDVLAGFSVSIRSATRDVNFNPGGQGPL